MVHRPDTGNARAEGHIAQRSERHIVLSNRVPRERKSASSNPFVLLSSLTQAMQASGRINIEGPVSTATQRILCVLLEIEVRGKRGFGYCKSMPGAVSPFERLKSRLRPRRVEGVRPIEVSDNSDGGGEEYRTPEPTDLIFPKWQSELFKAILEDGESSVRQRRPTAYGVQPTAHIHQHAVDGGGQHLSNR
jgi:hypothetical protein